MKTDGADKHFCGSSSNLAEVLFRRIFRVFITERVHIRRFCALISWLFSIKNEQGQIYFASYFDWGIKCHLVIVWCFMIMFRARPLFTIEHFHDQKRSDLRVVGSHGTQTSIPILSRFNLDNSTEFLRSLYRHENASLLSAN